MPVPITIIGNLTRDVELSHTSGGIPFGKSAVAVNHRQKDDAGNWVDGEPSFYNITLWRELAEHAATSLSKGSRVIVAGMIRQEHWTAPDGTARSDHAIQVDEIGPSLKWATCSVEKVKTNGAGGRAAPTPDQPPPDEPAGW